MKASLFVNEEDEEEGSDSEDNEKDRQLLLVEIHDNIFRFLDLLFSRSPVSFEEELELVPLLQ